MDRKRTIEEILGNMRSIRHMMDTTFRPFSADHDFTYAQMVILHIVKYHPGIGIKELAASLGITSSAATQQVDSLVRKGYLVREGNAADRRSLNLRVSADMDNRIEQMKTAFLEKMTGHFSVLSDDELAAYAELNRKIANKILGK